MINIAQTGAATSGRLCRRWDCTLIAQGVRCSKDKFRPQPVWNL